jgi:hypothetical protein
MEPAAWGSMDLVFCVATDTRADAYYFCTDYLYDATLQVCRLWISHCNIIKRIKERNSQRVCLWLASVPFPVYAHIWGLMVFVEFWRKMFTAWYSVPSVCSNLADTRRHVKGSIVITRKTWLLGVVTHWWLDMLLSYIPLWTGQFKPTFIYTYSWHNVSERRGRKYCIHAYKASPLWSKTKKLSFLHMGGKLMCSWKREFSSPDTCQ